MYFYSGKERELRYITYVGCRGVHMVSCYSLKHHHRSNTATVNTDDIKVISWKHHFSIVQFTGNRLARIIYISRYYDRIERMYIKRYGFKFKQPWSSRITRLQLTWYHAQVALTLGREVNVFILKYRFIVFI